MDSKVLGCSLEDLAKLHSLQLDEYEPEPLVDFGQVENTGNLKGAYLASRVKIADLASSLGCSYVGCYRFQCLGRDLGYIGEAIALKKR